MMRQSEINWSNLTVLAEKRKYFSIDVYFREAFDIICRHLGARSNHFFHKYSLSFIKPDCLVSRMGQVYLEELLHHQFDVVAYRKIWINRDIMRNIWRYQWNIATLDRLFILTKLNSACEILLLIVRNSNPSENHIPTSVRMSAAKGSAKPEERQKGTIRSTLRCPNQFLSALHVSDEPADLVRELGIFFSEKELVAFLNDIESMPVFEICKLIKRDITELETSIDYCELDLKQSAIHALELISKSGIYRHLSTRDLRLLSDATKNKVKYKSESWREFIHMLDTLGLKLPLWDEIVLGSYLAQADISNSRQLINQSGYEGWLRRSTREKSSLY